MARVDDVELPLNRAGGMVLLAGVSLTDWVEILDHGVDSRLAVGSRGMVVTGIDPDLDAERAAAQVRDMANRALDLIAIRSVASHALADPSMPYLTWSPTPRGPILRLWCEVHSTFKLSAGRGPARTPLSWHESMRYFRMSQVTTDLFDAFRNIYLALESLLSQLEPVQLNQRRKPEGEGQWTRRALGAADAALRAHNSAMSIGRYLSTPPSADPVADIFQDLYVNARTAIFHAKAGRQSLLPQDWQNRSTIQDALERYARMYVDLAEALLGAWFLRSGLGSGGFDGLKSMLETWQVGLSGEVFGSLDSFDRAAADRLTVLATVREPSLDAPFRSSVIGVASGRPIRELPSPAHTVGARTEAGDPVTVEPLGVALDCSGIERLEVVMTYAAFGSGFKVRYAS